MRVLATFSLAFAAGCALAQYAPEEWRLPFAALAALAALLFFPLRRRGCARALCISLGLAISVGCYCAHAALVLRPNEALVGTEQTMTVELCDYPRPTAYGARCKVRTQSLPGYAVYYGKDTLLGHEPGERVTAEMRCADAVHLSDDEDRATTFTSSGVYLLLYGRGEEHFEMGRAGALRYLPQRMAHRLSGVLDALFPARESGFFHALLLGDKTRMTTLDRAALTEAGLYHITAVSGLHCGFLALLLSFFIGRDKPRLRCALLLPFLAAYALVTGASPSVVRAALMLALVLFADLFERESDAATTFSFALLVLLAANPFAIGSISLQLSFAAVGGILWLTPKLSRAAAGQDILVRAVVLSAAATLGATVFTAPLSALYFGKLALISFVSNLFCLPAVSFAFGLGLAAALAGLVLLPLGKLLAAAALLPARYLLAAAGLLQRVPYHALHLSQPLSVLWLLYVYVLFALALLLGRARRSYLTAAALAVVTLISAAALNAHRFHDGALHLLVLDVGQGQSILAMQDGHAALIDCGSSDTYRNAGEIAADYLEAAGYGAPEEVILTHAHADHANGLEVLFFRAGAGELLASETAAGETGALADSMGVPVRTLSGVERIVWGDTELNVYPVAGSADGEACILISRGEFDLLVTGDITTAQEALLLAQYDLPDVEVLIVGHHGSKNATGDALLDAVAPETAVVSVGRNSYGHPTADTLGRLDAHDVAVYRTDRQGTIHIRVN